MTPEEVENSGACSDCLAGATDEEIEAWIDQASDIIAIVTGMRVAGECSLVARPCRDGARCFCDCCHLDAIPLGDPKPTIDSVWIDGEELPADEYDLHWGLNGWSLVRLGDGVTRPTGWPSHQERWRSDTAADTFAIYLTVGVPVDLPLVQAAVLEIVCELAASSLGGYQNVNQLEPGVIQAQLGGTTIQVDPDRLARYQTGEVGPNMAKLVGIYAPAGRFTSAVYAPELNECWSLNLRVAPVGS